MSLRDMQRGAARPGADALARVSRIRLPLPSQLCNPNLINSNKQAWFQAARRHMAQHVGVVQSPDTGFPPFRILVVASPRREEGSAGPPSTNLELCNWACRRNAANHS